MHVCIHPPQDFFHDQDDDMALFQIQIEHAAQRSITFQMRDSFNDFLANANQEDKTIPANLQQLEKDAGVKLVVSDKADPELVGFKQWRVAWYCPDPCNFLLLLDGWFEYKAKQIAREQPVQVILHPYLNIDISGLQDSLSYEHYVVNEPAANLPLHIFEAQPVVHMNTCLEHLASCVTPIVLLIWIRVRGNLDVAFPKGLNIYCVF